MAFVGSTAAVADWSTRAMVRVVMRFFIGFFLFENFYRDLMVF